MKEKVLVLGAGISGLACAHSLKEHGFQVTVLEARARAGGRLWTESSLGFAFDLGASVLHDAKHNELLKLGKQLKIRFKGGDYADAGLYDLKGQKIPQATSRHALNQYGSLVERAVQKAQDRKDVPLAAAIRKISAPLKLSRSQRDFRRWHEASSAIVSAADNIGLSAKYYDESGVLESESLAPVGGFSPYLQYFMKDLDVRFEHWVESVKITDKNVRVRTSKGNFTADRAVVTLPLGVLKQGTVKFDPPLPPLKRKAIKRLGMGTLNKAVLLFPDDCTFFKKAPHDFLGFLLKHKFEFARYLNDKHLRDVPALTGFIGGRAAAQIEGLSNKQITRHLMKELERAFGPLPEPSGVLVTRWHSDPFAHGSYSYVAVGASLEDFDVLAQPVGARLFFAGEATHREHCATLQGAYLSGLREAQRIIQKPV